MKGWKGTLSVEPQHFDKSAEIDDHIYILQLGKKIIFFPGKIFFLFKTFIIAVTVLAQNSRISQALPRINYDMYCIVL